MPAFHLGPAISFPLQMLGMFAFCVVLGGPSLATQNGAGFALHLQGLNSVKATSFKDQLCLYIRAAGASGTSAPLHVVNENLKMYPT